jgi:hypothetical protein
VVGYRSRARQWSRASFAIAVLFSSLGLWGFDGAWGLAVLSAIAGLYFHIVGRRRSKLPDPALMLERAQELAAEGRVDEARGLLTKTVRQSPWFTEAREYLEKIS